MTEPSAPAAEPQPPAPSRWARVRAALIALVLLVQGVSALPNHPVSKANLARPEAVRAVAVADGVLGAVGLSPGRPALSRALRDGSRAMVDARGMLLRPFEPLFHYTGTHQQWGLFLLGTRECFGIHVDAQRRDGGWQRLYHALDPGPAPLEAVLRYRRLRGIYNPRAKNGPHGQYPGFVHALARRVFARAPGYLRLRVQMERLRVGEAGSAPQSLGFEYALELRRPVAGAAAP